MGTYFLFPRWKGFFLGVLVDLVEPSFELALADCSASSPDTSVALTSRLPR